VRVVEQADLTARARIRDAAMEHFAEHGFERATIRGIAQTAGVSSGLVRHHFGSKQDLRDACDAHLSGLIRRLNDDVRAGRISGLSPVSVMRPYQHYIARALSEGAAGAVFDGVVRLSTEWLAEIDARRPDPPAVDLTARATLVTAMALGIPILAAHVSRNLGVDIMTRDGERTMQLALLDIYSHPLLGLAEAADARAALADDRADQGALTFDD
jgi:AcrR family transcriptional regulator